MDCAVASAFGLSVGDCCFVFRAPELEKHNWRSRDWNCWPLVAGIRGRVFEKTGSADDDGTLRFHAKSAVPWQRNSCGWSGVGNAFLDFWMRSRSLLCCRLLHRDAKRRRRVAWALR